MITMTKPASDRLLPMRQKCDICGVPAMTEFKHGTLFGRTMRLCRSCTVYLNHAHSMELSALEMNFGLSENMDPDAGLQRVKALERQIKAQNGSEVELLALGRMKRLFQARLARKQ